VHACIHLSDESVHKPMKALRYERSLPRFAAARIAGPKLAPKVGPLQLADIDPPELPGEGWRRVRPRLSGICGSDLATVNARSSRWFEPIVSFPFVPGHEVVGDVEGGGRVVVEPVLGCVARGIDQPCEACATQDVGRCRNIAFGHLEPGLQIGYCADTSGGWSLGLVAHHTQLHDVPDAMSDEAAVMVEPTACGIRGAFKAASGHDAGGVMAVIGAGTLGLCTVAALMRWAPPDHLIVAAKHPEQKRFAKDLGAHTVVPPDQLRRAVRRVTGSMAIGDGPIDRLTDGAHVTIDCVGSEASLADALAVTRPGGRIVLLGMPGEVHVDLTPLWHREIELVGAYAYGCEHVRPGRTFDLAFDLVHDAGLERLVSATYPLDRWQDALIHAEEAGRRGAVKVAFDLRNEKR
jgi:threonine dehydrogenase-like Zn-dependent dehydrogenase